MRLAKSKGCPARSCQTMAEAIPSDWRRRGNALRAACGMHPAQCIKGSKPDSGSTEHLLRQPRLLSEIRNRGCLGLLQKWPNGRNARFSDRMVILTGRHFHVTKLEIVGQNQCHGIFNHRYMTQKWTQTYAKEDEYMGKVNLGKLIRTL